MNYFFEQTQDDRFDIPYEQIIEQIKSDSEYVENVGIRSFTIAKHFLKTGLDVDLIYFHPAFFNFDTINQGHSQAEIKDYLIQAKSIKKTKN